MRKIEVQKLCVEDMVVHAYNPNRREAEAEGSL